VLKDAWLCAAADPMNEEGGGMVSVRAKEASAREAREPGHDVRIGFLAVPVALAILVAASITAEITRRALPTLLKAEPCVEPFLVHSGMILFSCLAALAIGRGRLGRFGLRRCPPQAILRAAAMGFAIGALADSTAALLRLPKPAFLRSYSIAQQVLFIWLWASLAEEVLVRGLLQGMMAVWADRSIKLLALSLAWPAVAGAVFFAGMHLPLLMLGTPLGSVLAIVAFAFTAGLAAGQFRHVTGSLWAAVAVHAAANMPGTLFQLLSRH
jgi:membrane protease YdiL (CAAX protease family)